MTAMTEEQKTKFKGDMIKKIFVVTAYLLYVLVTMLKNQYNLNLGQYEYIIVAIIGVLLKIASSISEIQNIITTFDNMKIDEMVTQINQIHTMTARATARELQSYNVVNNSLCPQPSNLTAYTMQIDTPQTSRSINEPFGNESTHCTFKSDCQIIDINDDMAIKVTNK